MDSGSLLTLLGQIALILALARLCGAAAQRCGQPAVIGEIVAGILLGPSLLGWLAPGLSASLFPTALRSPLELLAQLGLILFLFMVGLDVDPSALRGNRTHIASIALSGIGLPLLLGGILAATVLYPINGLAGVSLASFSLCIATAMAITAFPVLACIVEDRGLTGTRLGSLAVACASVDDVCAWCLLAATIALHRSGSLLAALPTLLGVALFLGLMALLMPRLGPSLLRRFQRQGLDAGLQTTVFVLVLLAAMATEAIGIDVIFGGFLCGAMLPRDRSFRQALKLRSADFASLVLLPIFFALSGFHTDLRLLFAGRDTLVLVPAVVSLAVAGKAWGVWGAARLCRLPAATAWNLAWLMNCRGLTELIVLNIGLRLKILSPTIFGLFVVMALATTALTGPLLRLQRDPAAQPATAG
ncbi:MAG: cation:proton antiporter [Synechococcaceae cyanobacterium]|nr:cation:proton antiporter [Synechococcaceae cyanobacterium]